MEFKLIQQIVKNIQDTITNTVIGSSRSLMGHTFKVKTINFPKIQKINGIVTVSNQKRVEKELKTNGVTLKTIFKWLKSFKLPKEIKVSNFPNFPKHIPYPTKMEVSNFPTPVEPIKNIRVSNQPTKEIKDLSKLLKAVEKAVKGLKLDPTIKVQAPRAEKVIVPAPQVSVTQQEIDYEKLASLIPIAETLDIDKLSESIAKEIAASMVTVGGGGSGGKYAFRDSNGKPSHGIVNDLHQQSTVVEDRWGLNNTNKAGNITYTGQEDIDGNWIIRKITKTGSNIAMSYATEINNASVTTYTDAWNDRTTMTYDLYKVAFNRD